MNEDSYISTTESIRAPILKNYPSALKTALNMNAVNTSVTTGKSRGHQTTRSNTQSIATSKNLVPTLQTSLANRWKRDQLSPRSVVFQQTSPRTRNAGKIINTSRESARDEYVDQSINVLKKIKRARDLVFVNPAQNHRKRKTVASQERPINETQHEDFLAELHRDQLKSSYAVREE